MDSTLTSSTPVPNVQMRLRQSYEGLDQAGDYYIEHDAETGLGEIGILIPVWHEGELADVMYTSIPIFRQKSDIPINPNADVPYWAWNGDTARPTLKPSISIMQVLESEEYGTFERGWHGWVTNGELVTTH